MNDLVTCQIRAGSSTGQFLKDFPNDLRYVLALQDVQAAG
jgi:hypothetical protein